MSLERVWGEFGESPNALQTHSSFPKKQWKNKKQWKHMSHSKLTKKSLLDVIFPKKQKMKNEFGESPKSFQTQKNICVHNFFLSGCMHILFEKKLRTHISFFLFFFFKKNKFLKKYIKQRFLCEFEASLEWVWREFGESPNSLQTHKAIFAWWHLKKKRGKT